MLRCAPLLGLLLVSCSEYALDDKDAPPDEPLDSGSPAPPTDLEDSAPPPEGCELEPLDPIEVGSTDACAPPTGSFTPVVEWSYGSTGDLCHATVAVGDLDQDGMPELVANVAGLFGSGDLVILDGRGKLLHSIPDSLGYGSSVALGDLEGDGALEIVAVREYASSLLAEGEYRAVAFGADGSELWESASFVGDDFDYATAPALSDMDHDGLAEVVLGRVILNHDGSTRGIGEHGRGSWGTVGGGGFTLDEASVSAVADLDLDGTEEVIVGHAMYAPDGSTLWHDPAQEDGMVAVANLDDDPEGEFIASSFDTARAVDTDGSVLWTVTLPSANIVSPAAIEDLDADGYPEVIVAGGNQLVVLEHTGATAWTAAVTDMSGASGASVFDFEGDGQPEVVYLDEVQMVAYDGLTGAVKFYSADHASVTMMDYPVVADVDADDQAEIVVAHSGHSSALSVYGDLDESWAPARRLWNQHAYSIHNIDDDLGVPVEAVPSFTSTNSWHSAFEREAGEPLDELMGEIVELCERECDRGLVELSLRVHNLGETEIPAGLPLALYARHPEGDERIGVVLTEEPVPGGWSSATQVLGLPIEAIEAAEALILSVDDDGAGQGQVQECDESNNLFVWEGPFCAG